jgi:intracellular sulfur oxidation DsrE/DsrF family protein
MKIKLILLSVISVFTFSASIYAHDDEDGHRNKFWNTENCVASKWYDADGNNITIEDKFGSGSMAVTRCLSKTKKAKVLYQINTECKNAACTAPYAIGNIVNHINDYEITHGMSPDDYEIVVIVHSAGWKLILDNNSNTKHEADNPFQAQMEALLARDSVKVLFCQNTANGKGVVKAHMIDGVGFVTAGVSAISDLQERGYRYVQP